MAERPWTVPGRWLPAGRAIGDAVFQDGRPTPAAAPRRPSPGSRPSHVRKGHEANTSRPSSCTYSSYGKRRLIGTDRNFERRPPRLQPSWNFTGPSLAASCHFFRLSLLVSLLISRVFWECGGLRCRSSVRFMPRSSWDTGSANGPMDFAVRDELPCSLSREKPLETPPRGRFLRRTRENAVILARTVSDPLGWRRKKRSEEIPPVGLRGTRGRVPTAARGTDGYLTGPTRPP
jgi:hypothetical protein